MGIQEVGSNGKERIQEYTGKKQPTRAEGFQESLMQNLKSHGQKNAVSVADRMGVSLSGNPARIRVNAVTDREAIQSTEVRHMSYEESDHIEIAVTQGYTLKGKLEGSHVYVEAKYEDGRFEAYRVDTGKVQEQTQHKIERFALETAESMKG
ncbi:MAG: hypothetical protein NC416_08270 [Eubacterium sp.]|nr:hypothetical protein [Eubacterium sp.]